MPPRSGGAGPRMATPRARRSATSVASVVLTAPVQRRGVRPRALGDLPAGQSGHPAAKAMPPSRCSRKSGSDPALVRMAQRGVPGAPAVVEAAPRDRMVLPHRSARVARLIQSREDVDESQRPRVRRKVVPLVRPHPDFGKVTRGGMDAVDHVQGRRLDRRVAPKLGAEESEVPRPAVLGVGRGVHTDEPAPSPDEPHERVLLPRSEDVARRQDEQDGVVRLEGIVAKDVGALGGHDGEAVLGPELPDRRDRIRDRGVTESRRLRENQHTLRADSGRGRGADERDQDRARRRNQGHSNAEVSCSGTKAVPSGFA